MIMSIVARHFHNHENEVFIGRINTIIFNGNQIYVDGHLVATQVEFSNPHGDEVFYWKLEDEYLPPDIENKWQCFELVPIGKAQNDS
jgi:hypothetical protein